MAERLSFGTDGIRGRAGLFPIDGATATLLGLQLGAGGARVVLARDTRPSGAQLCRALAVGVRAAGGEPVAVGVLPTAGLSLLLAHDWGERGVMVTASHNPAHDNGLKVLGADGRKLADDEQAALEEALNRALASPPAPLDADGALDEARHEEAVAFYLWRLLRALPRGRWLEGRHLVADAAQGAGCRTLPAALEALGARVTRLACDGDGQRINAGCGVMDPAALAAAVSQQGADGGVALDGDADRALLVSASGRLLDGDALLYLLAEAPAVVGTVMSNSGLALALRRRGIELYRTPVGDRFVDAALHERGLRVGGESSGHICLADGFPTADGALSALRVLAGGGDLDQRLADYQPFPRVQINVPVARRRPLKDLPQLVAAQREAEALLGEGGRSLLRYSGTEPLLRVMVEAQQQELADRVAQELVAAARSALG